jgi:hypothetical protein
MNCIVIDTGGAREKRTKADASAWGGTQVKAGEANTQKYPIRFLPDYRSRVNHLFLKYGRQWKRETPAKLPKGVRWGEESLCYFNAYFLLLKHDRFTYVEGYADGVEHAWCIDQDGVVVDNTPWHENTLCYDGIAFRSEWVIEVILEQYREGRKFEEIRYSMIFGFAAENPALHTRPEEMLAPQWYPFPKSLTRWKSTLLFTDPRHRR